MEHVKLKVSEILMGKILEKDLQDNEQICPTCKGLGMIIYDFDYYVKDNNSINAYNNMHFGPCYTCYNGVVKVCKYCGKQLLKGQRSCDCIQQQTENKQYEDEIIQQAILKATEITQSEIGNAYLSDYKGFNYYSSIDDFIEQIQDQYSEKSHNYTNFDKFYEFEVPKVLWLCEIENISLDAYNIVSNACEELHEYAMDSISSADIKELQNYLNGWCNKQSGTSTCNVVHKKYINVRKDWFTERSE